MPKPLKLGSNGRPAVFQAGDTVPVDNGGTGLTSLPLVPGYRLTTETGNPDSSADRTGQTSIYLTPKAGGLLPANVSGVWTPRAPGELSLALASLTSGKPYDVFAYDSSGTTTLALGPAWTGATSRGTGAGTTEISRNSTTGLWTNANAVTSGPAAGRGLYVGTIYTTGTASTADSATQAFVYNAFGANARPIIQQVATDESRSTTTYAALTTPDMVEFVLGQPGDVIVRFECGAYNSTAGSNNYSKVQLDGVDQGSALQQTLPNAGIVVPHVLIVRLANVSAGYHSVTVLHKGDGGGPVAHFLNRTLSLSLQR